MPLLAGAQIGGAVNYNCRTAMYWANGNPGYCNTQYYNGQYQAGYPYQYQYPQYQYQMTYPQQNQAVVYPQYNQQYTYPQYQAAVVYPQYTGTQNIIYPSNRNIVYPQRIYERYQDPDYAYTGGKDKNYYNYMNIPHYVTRPDGSAVYFPGATRP